MFLDQRREISSYGDKSKCQQLEVVKDKKMGQRKYLSP